MVAITSERKPLRLPLLPDDKTYSRAVNQGRYKIERVIANIQYQGLARPAQRLQKTTGRLPCNHHSNPRDYIHLLLVNSLRVPLRRSRHRQGPGGSGLNG